MSSRRTLPALLFLMGVAGALRFQVDAHQVWHDEAFTQVFAAGHEGSDWLSLFDGGIHPVSALRQARVYDGSKTMAATLHGLAVDEPQHPPLYYMAARAWASLEDAGFEDVVRESSVDDHALESSALENQVLASQAHDVDAGIHWLRWLSVFISLLTVPVLSWLGAELKGPRGASKGNGFLRAQVLLPAFYVVSPFFVLYGMEAREYALWVLTTAAASAALLRARRLTTTRAYLAYAVLLTLSFYVALSSATVALAHTLFVVVAEGPATIRRRKPTMALARFVLCGVTTFALFLPWLVPVMENFGAMRASTAWTREIVIPVAQLFAALMLNLGRAFVDFGAEDLRHWSAVPLGVVLFGVSVLAWKAARSSKGDGVEVQDHVVSDKRAPDGSASKGSLLLLCLFLAPLLLLFVPDLLLGGIRSLSTRYLIPSLLALLAWAALGFASSEEASSEAAAKPTFSKKFRRAGLLGVLGVMLASSIQMGSAPTPWTKRLSRDLPRAAALINAETAPLVVANHEQHHPGNMLALSGSLRDDARVQLLPTVEAYRLPAYAGAVFLFSPSPRFVEELRNSTGRTVTPLIEDIHLSLWRVESE